jgi:hypothetical protein
MGKNEKKTKEKKKGSRRDPEGPNEVTKNICKQISLFSYIQWAPEGPKKKPKKEKKNKFPWEDLIGCPERP